MSNIDLSRYIVSKETPFLELYGRFSLAVKQYQWYITPKLIKQILVVDETGKLYGIITENELSPAIIAGDCFKLTASDIACTDFTFLYDDVSYRERALELFFERSFSAIPVVSRTSEKPVDIVTRWEFIELRMISFAQYGEDIVLNYVLRNVEKIFYIDVGAYDPWEDSITKWFYSSGRGGGINIEPQEEEFAKLEFDRPNDVNINTALGETNGSLKLYGNMGITTAVADYATDKSNSFTALMTTLKDVCVSYVKEEQQIHFLKIDVEGYEKQVLLGADFVNYRPWIMAVEATIPLTETPTFDEWEYILLDNKYAFAKQYGINRFYIAQEHEELKSSFIELEDMKKRLIVPIPDILRYSE